MTIKLNISTDLSLPVEAVTQTFSILAKRGAGKTYTASVMAEEFVKAGLPFVALDPTGGWWGLRSSADGKNEGLPVIIIGGSHGDLPLEPTAGKVVADLVVDQPGFYVLDLSETASNAEQDRFARDFAERLYRRKASNRQPLHLFVDEADSFAPQRPMPGQQAMLGAFEAIVRRGRIRGLGVTLITQRAAVLNKNVLTQTEVLIVLQTTSPQDQDAIDEWIKRNGTTELRDKVMGSMASLHRGEAWVWSPVWLNLCHKVQVRARETFDASATPKMGQAKLTPQRLAPIDVEKLSAEIRATIERAKANDPATLKAEIARLKKEAAQVKAPAMVQKEVPVLKEAQIQKLTRLVEMGFAAAEKIERQAQEIALAIRVINTRPVAPTPIPKLPTATPRPRIISSETETRTVSGGLRRIMIVLAQRPGISDKQAGLRAGLSSKGGTFANYLGQARSQNWITGNRNSLSLTDVGREALGDYESLPTGTALLAHYQNSLGGGMERMLTKLAHAYPSTMTAEELGEHVGIEASGGTFANYLGHLRSLELVTGQRSNLRASEEFFT